MRDVKRILVPVDFSAPSKAALETAVAVAERFGARIDVLHIVEQPMMGLPEISIAVPSATAQQFEPDAQVHAERAMKEFLFAFRARVDGPEMGQEIVRGDPVESIIALTKDGAYDLIVMGTHGRRGFEHMILGSVAERVVRKSVCPVLTTRADTKV